MQTAKKSLSLFLALALALSVFATGLPAYAEAAEDPEDPASQAEEETPPPAPIFPMNLTTPWRTTAA